MPHAAFERGVAFPAELFGQVFKIVRCADVQDRGPSTLLLVFRGHAFRKRLERHAVGLADFEVVGRRAVVSPYRNRLPWTVVSH